MEVGKDRGGMEKVYPSAPAAAVVKIQHIKSLLSLIGFPDEDSAHLRDGCEGLARYFSGHLMRRS